MRSGRSRLVLGVTLASFLGLPVAAQEVVVQYDYQADKLLNDPEIHAKDTVEVRLTGINPISYDYKVDLEEVDPFESFYDDLPISAIPTRPAFLAQTCSIPDCDTLAEPAKVYCREVRQVETTLGLELPKAPGIVTNVRLFPAVAREKYGDELKVAFDALEKEVAPLEAISASIPRLEARLPEGGAAKAQFEACLQLLGGKLTGESIPPMLERMRVYRERRVAIYSGKLAQKKKGYFGKFIEGSVSESVTATVVEDLKKWLETAAPDALNRKDVEAYLATTEQRKSFRLVVEPVLPVLVSLGYVWTQLDEIQYDDVADIASGNTIIARTKDEGSLGATVVLASYGIGPFWDESKSWRLHATLGTNVDDPGKMKLGGLSVGYKRFMLTVGVAQSDMEELIGSGTEGAVVPPGSEVPTRTTDQEEGFVGFTFVFTN